MTTESCAGAGWSGVRASIGNLLAITGFPVQDVWLNSNCSDIVALTLGNISIRHGADSSEFGLTRSNLRIDLTALTVPTNILALAVGHWGKN